MLCAISFIANKSQAQFTTGIKANTVFNDTEIVSGAVDLDNTVKTMQGYSIGGFAEYDVSNNWSLNAELLYKHIGFQIVESTSFGLFGLDIPLGATLRTTVNYLEMPLLVKYKHDLGRVKAYVEAGPSINYALNGKVKTVANSILDFNITETDLNLGADSYNRLNTSGNLGIGIIYPYTEQVTLTAGIRYSKDLSNSVNLPVVNAGIKNNSIALGIGVATRF